jgi:hypothetical protein
VARADVTVKKILRTCRYFYDLKLNELSHYKAKRNRTRSKFLVYTDFYVDKDFDKDILRLFGFTKFESVSEHLAALIQPKCLLTELETIKADIELLQSEKQTS